jgi:hypothetical protein
MATQEFFFEMGISLRAVEEMIAVYKKLSF